MTNPSIALVLGSLTLLASCANFAPLPGLGTHRPTPEANPPTAGAPAGNSDWRTTSAVLIGVRELDEGDWDPVENQFLLGAEFAFRPRGSVLAVEAGSSWSFGAKDNVGGSALDVSGSVFDLYAGPRLIFDLADDTVHPYLGAGIEWVLAEYVGGLGTVSVHDDDSTVAGYAHAGVMFDVSDSMFVGIDARMTFGSEVTLFGIDGDADSYQFAALIGSNW